MGRRTPIARTGRRAPLRGRRICIGTATIFPRAQLVRPVLTHLLRGSSESFRGPRCLSIPRRHIGPEKHHRSWGFGPQHRCWSRLAHHQDRRAERTCIARPTFLRVTERKTRSAKAWFKSSSRRTIALPRHGPAAAPRAYPTKTRGKSPGPTPVGTPERASPSRWGCHTPIERRRHPSTRTLHVFLSLNIPTRCLFSLSFQPMRCMSFQPDERLPHRTALHLHVALGTETRTRFVLPDRHDTHRIVCIPNAPQF
jgi:hypothetical protein